VKAKLGSGKRFAAVERSAAASGARDPGAVAAAAGRAKYGQTKMTALANHGKAVAGEISRKDGSNEQQHK
jgi:hypothetical protein